MFLGIRYLGIFEDSDKIPEISISKDPWEVGEILKIPYNKVTRDSYNDLPKSWLNFLKLKAQIC